MRGAEVSHATGEVHVRLAVLEAVLLSVVTIVTAWAGYSAAKWGTDSRLDLAQASALRIEANRAFAVAAENRNFDSTTFSTVLLAAVISLVGIGSTFEGHVVRVALTSVGGVMLLAAVALIAQQPRPR